MLVAYYCVADHPRTRWVKTTSILLPLRILWVDRDGSNWVVLRLVLQGSLMSQRVAGDGISKMTSSHVWVGWLEGL